ncbi:oxidoreductase [Geobacter argillaceus]|uniref:2,4-dienoyl-CoA reductase (NADPH2) n=1 Tax=Geobacter argillaceus TaxID=345631 RepID=A0A562VPJ5_9BACT|nr:FAD-dependent oxidoreductase [Geobacter argillaceus]TWJ19855.1 2,4-dienoyl-CoA reductase (NADPH2) [Geobacter argillaceus]
MNDPLFQPITINGMEVKNRIFMPAMHLNMAANYVVTDRLVDFYAERARGGAGMITVGYATVDERSGNPTNIGAHEDSLIPGLARLAVAIRENGARASVQLNHAGRYNHSMLMGGRRPVAPSPIPSRLTREIPDELDADGIGEVVGSFAKAARRVQEAGFDSVEVLAGTGYLISEFLSPLTNQRSDGYGGSFENRCRFGLEVIQAVRRAVGDSFPLLVRMNGNDFMKGGSGREELREFAVRLVAAGVDALCVNVGWHEAQVPQIVTEVPRGVFAYLARGIRDRVDVPVIASHRINDPAVARELISDGTCDMVAIGRALIADPWFPEKARHGREQEIVHCVACAQGCFDNLFKMKPVECLCNPLAGYERARELGPTAKPLNLMVVGGGPAGMSAAIAAAARGHRVTLVERCGRLGGQLLLAGAPPGRDEFRELAHDLEQQVARAGVTVRLDVDVDRAFLTTAAPDAVILATGGIPVTPAIPGVELPHVCQAWDILTGKTTVGQRVAVIGGGAVGIETALLLAEKGTLSGEALKFLLVHEAEPPETLYTLATRGSKEVTVIEMLDELGSNFGKSTRWGMMQDVARYGVGTRTASRVVAIDSRFVRIESNDRIEEIPADSVVLAVGTRSLNPLQEHVTAQGLPFRVVGDAESPAMVFDAMHQGFLAGREID